MKGEAMYPIYSFAVRWAEDGEQNPEYKHRREGLPDGRIWNGMQSYHMFRKPLSEKELNEKAREWWTKGRDAEGRNERPSIASKNPGDCVVTALFVRNETWCGSWFGHWTFDNGQTDEEVLASFTAFVDRMMLLQDQDRNAYCLMGAEDRYRWCGTKTGEPDERTDPPCRCKHCKEQGVIRIGH